MLPVRRNWFRWPVGRGGVVAAAVSWGTAAVLVHQLPAPLGWLPVVVLVAVTVGAWWISGWTSVLWFAAGAVWTTAHVHVRLAEWLPEDHQGGDFAVSGWVDGFPSHSTDQVNFPFRVESSEAPDIVPRRLRVTWYEPPADAVAPGANLDLVVRLKRPRGSLNPGGFDYARWLFQEGYGATGYVREGLVSTREDGGVARRWLMLRSRLAESLGSAAPTPDAAALLTALSIGERFGFEDPHWRTLRRTGTSHLMAISGLHVGYDFARAVTDPSHLHLSMITT